MKPLASRFSDTLPAYSTSTHFRGDVAPPSNHAFAGSPFITPEIVAWSNGNDFAYWRNDTAGTAFCFKSISSTSSEGVSAIIKAIAINRAHAWVRIDDGTDNNFLRVGIRNTGGINLDIVYRIVLGGSVISNDLVAGTTAASGFQIVEGIRNSSTQGRANFWAIGVAQEAFITVVNNAGFNFVPTRIGFGATFNGTFRGTVVFDWYAANK